MSSVQPVLRVEGLGVAYGKGHRRNVHNRLTVRDVTFTVGPGEIVGLVGESGSGKSTCAKAIMGLAPITQGLVEIDGERVTEKRSASLSRAAQMVYQDPGSSLNPSIKVASVLVELLRGQGQSRSEARHNAIELLDRVGLAKTFADRYPLSLSGGQKQRVAIARALATGPKLIVADEATSALDVSVQATILNLLMSLTEDFGLSVVLISHDLTVVRRVCDRLLVMKDGRVVEAGDTEVVLSDPQHPYTRQLLASIPKLPMSESLSSSSETL